MNYRELFRRLGTLIVAPKKAWVEIATESPRRDVMATFVYPIIALGGLVVLFSALVGGGLERVTFQSAMMDICSYCISLFGGFFLAAYWVDLVGQKYLMRTANMSVAQLFAGYAMGVVFAADIIVVLFPQFFIFKWILMAYTLYIVWEGSDVIFAVGEEHRMTFTALAAGAVVVSPALVRMLFNTLSNLLG